MNDNGISIACDGTHIVVTIFDRMTGERFHHDMSAMEALTFAHRVLKEAVILLIKERAR